MPSFLKAQISNSTGKQAFSHPLPSKEFCQETKNLVKMGNSSPNDFLYST
jgi:hypothetical protein